MVATLLTIQEEDALKRILRHHNVPVAPKLIADLSTLINWVREVEHEKGEFVKPEPAPPLLISLLGAMGIYGAEYIDKVPVTE